MNFTDLPKDILNYILTFFKNKDYCNCLKSSKLFNKNYNLTSKNNYLKRKYEIKSIIELAINENFEGLEFLLSSNFEHKVNINLKTSVGYTPLMLVNTGPSTELLLKNGADPNSRDFYCEKTALMYASEYSSIEKVELLLKYGADPNLKDKSEYTALMFACKRSEGSSIEIVSLLLKYGANSKLKNFREKTALVFARENPNKETSHKKIDLLLKYNGKDEAVFNL